MKNDFSTHAWIFVIIGVVVFAGVTNYWWYRHILPWLIGCGHG